MASLIYTVFFKDEALGLIDWDTHDIRVALIGDSYAGVVSRGDSQWQSGSDPFDMEISGTGYTANGDTLASASVTLTGDTVFIDGDTITWAASTITARGAVIYNNSHANKDLIAWFEFDAEKSSTNGNFTIAWHTLGMIAQYQG